MFVCVLCFRVFVSFVSMHLSSQCCPVLPTLSGKIGESKTTHLWANLGLKYSMLNCKTTNMIFKAHIKFSFSVFSKTATYSLWTLATQVKSEHLSKSKMEGGAYGGGKAGGAFDPIQFVQRPQVILKALCLVSLACLLHEPGNFSCILPGSCVFRDYFCSSPYWLAILIFLITRFRFVFLGLTLKNLLCKEITLT